MSTKSAFRTTAGGGGQKNIQKKCVVIWVLKLDLN